MIILIPTFFWTTVLIKESLNFRLTAFQFFFLGNSINTFQWLSREHRAKALRYMNFWMVINSEYWSKPLNAHKVSVQITSLEQVLNICMIGTCMWRINEQLIVIYTNGSRSRKISLLHMHNCLLQIFVNDLKGTKATQLHFFLIASGESRYSHFAPF